MKPDVRIKLSIMMFLQYAVWGSWAVAFATYMFNDLKFQGVHVGWVYNTNQIAAILAPFFMGMIADRWFATERVLGVLHLGGAALLLYATQARDPATMFWTMLAYSMLYMPTLALTNSLSFRNMTNPDKEFPSIRVLGTIGWIVAGLVVGFVTGPTVQILYLAGGVSAVLGIFCFFLPHTPPVQAEAGSQPSAWGAAKMLKEPSFAMFMFVSFVISIALAFYYQLGNTFLTAINAPAPTALQTVGQVSEIFFMLILPLVVQKLGIRWTLTLGMAAWCVRYSLFWNGSLWPIVLIALPLHGICYDFFFVVSQIFVDNKAQRELRASAQGLLTFVTIGCGMFLGNLLAGLSVVAIQVPAKTIELSKAILPTFLWEQSAAATDSVARVTQWPGIWGPAAIGCGIAILLFLITFREPEKNTSEPLM